MCLTAMYLNGLHYSTAVAARPVYIRETVSGYASRTSAPFLFFISDISF
jgi:hypothetical protein